MPDLFRSSLQVVAALLCVLACFGVGVVLVRRYVGGSGAVGRAACVRILATGYLGHRRAIYVVDVLGRILVLGVTPTSITFLTSLEDREALERLFRETNRLPGVSFIGHCLERLWQKGGFGDGAKHSSSADQEKRERL